MNPPAPPRPAELTSLPHSGLSVGEFYSMHFMAGLLPLTAGLLMFGWRAALAVLLVTGATALGIAVWRRIGARGQQLSYPHAIWLAVLLAMMLPAHLATDQTSGSSQSPWYLLVAAGLLLAAFLWVLGGLGAGRINPLLVSYLLIATVFLDLLTPHWILQRKHLFLGDLLRGQSVDTRYIQQEPWTARYVIPNQDSVSLEAPASVPLSLYTRRRDKPPTGWLSIQSLMRDDLPPLEDLVFGGHPSPIGTGSAIAVLIGGLFLLYRGLIDFRIPLIILVSDFAGLLILPIPAVLRSQTTWHWVVSRQPDVGWATGITFANYELLASPALFMAFFLATAPTIRPMSRRARMIYSFLAGGASAAMQLYVSVAIGPYIALLIASLLTPMLDMWFRPRALI